MFFFTGDEAVVVASVVSVAAVVLLWVESTFEPTLGRILMGEVRMEGKTTDVTTVAPDSHRGRWRWRG